MPPQAILEAAPHRTCLVSPCLSLCPLLGFQTHVWALRAQRDAQKRAVYTPVSRPGSSERQADATDVTNSTGCDPGNCRFRASTRSGCPNRPGLLSFRSSSLLSSRRLITCSSVEAMENVVVLIVAGSNKVRQFIIGRVHGL